MWEAVGRGALQAALQAPRALARRLAGEAQRRGFDGWVLEAWSLWASAGLTAHPQLRSLCLG